MWTSQCKPIYTNLNTWFCSWLLCSYSRRPQRIRCTVFSFQCRVNFCDLKSIYCWGSFTSLSLVEWTLSRTKKWRASEDNNDYFQCLWYGGWHWDYFPLILCFWVYSLLRELFCLSDAENTKGLHQKMSLPTELTDLWYRVNSERCGQQFLFVMQCPIGGGDWQLLPWHKYGGLIHLFCATRASNLYY